MSLVIALILLVAFTWYLNRSSGDGGAAWAAPRTQRVVRRPTDRYHR